MDKKWDPDNIKGLIKMDNQLDLFKDKIDFKSSSEYQ